MKTLRRFCFVFALLAGGAGLLLPSSPAARADLPSRIPAPLAVMLAADAAPDAVSGVFVMTVRATGARDGLVYLNSEADYRDPRNLTVALTARAAAQLAKRLGADPRASLEGHEILVRGSAKRTRIDFLHGGEPTGKYYYQTHINVVDAAQLVVDPEPEDAEEEEGVSV